MMLPITAGNSKISPEGRKKLEHFYERFCMGENRKRYGLAHLVFACHAAFPLLLSPDLANLIWLNFRIYTSGGWKKEMPLIVVADLLASSLCANAGNRLYQFDADVRQYLLLLLRESAFFSKYDIQEFGEIRLTELAAFLKQYLADKNTQHANHTPAFKELNEFAVLAYTQPDALTAQLAQSLKSSMDAKNTHGQLRLNMLMKEFSGQYEVAVYKNSEADAEKSKVNSFLNLYKYSEVNKAAIFKKGADKIVDLLGGIEESFITYETPAGNSIELPIAAGLGEALERLKAAQVPEPHTEPQGENAIKKIQAVLIGISDYQNKSMRLKAPVDDVHKFSDCLKKLYDCSVDQLLDEHAVKQEIMITLNEALRDSGPDDLVLFYFAGHASNRGEKHQLELWDYSEHGFSEKNENDYCITEREFRAAIDQYAINDPHVVLVLDTHSGSDGWINIENPKYIALMASHVEEWVYELPETGSLFTDALCEALLQFQGKISYRNLYHEVFKKLDACLINEVHKVQTAKFYLHEESWNYLFLSSQRQNKKPDIRKLLQEFGYNMPGEDSDGMGFLKSLEAFFKDHSINFSDHVISNERKALHYLELKKQLQSESHLNVLSIGTQYETHQEYNHLFVESFGKPISFLPIEHLEDERQWNNMGTLQRIVQAHVLIIGIDQHVLEQPLNQSAFGKLLARGCAYNKEIVLLLEIDVKIADIIRPEFMAFRANIRHIRYQEDAILLKGDIEAFALEMINLLELERTLSPLQKRIITEIKLKSGTLKIDGLGLDVIPDAVFELSHLTELNLEHNNVTSVPEAISSLANLKILNLNNNPLHDFPDSILKLPNLEVLDLSNTKVESLPEALTQLKHFRKLSIHNCKVHIPEAVLKIRGLQVQGLSYHPLRLKIEETEDANVKMDDLKETVFGGDSSHIIAEEDESYAEYVLRTQNGSYYVSNPFDRYRPVIAPVAITEYNAVRNVYGQLLYISEWEYLKNLEDAFEETEPNDEILKIEFIEKESGANLVDENGIAVVFSKTTDGSFANKIKIVITNTAAFDIYFNMLYLTFDFGANTELSGDTHFLKPDERMTFPKKEDDFFDLFINDVPKYYNWKEETEYYKFFISRDYFDVSAFRLEGLPPPQLPDSNMHAEEKFRTTRGVRAQKPVGWFMQTIVQKLQNPLYNHTPIADQQAMINNPSCAFFGKGLYTTRILFVPVNQNNKTIEDAADTEADEIKRQISKSKRRESFSFIVENIASLQYLIRTVSREQPTIIHVTGKIGSNELANENKQQKSINFKSIPNELIQLTGMLTCLVLNRCATREQAVMAAGYIPFTILIPKNLSRVASFAFVIAFYQELAKGKTIEEAFSIGSNNITVVLSNKKNIPVLFKRK